MNGIDISNWQNGINLAAVPFDFVICKATEGTRYVSPDCDRQIQQAIGLGKLVGVYHYVNGGDAEAEAEYFYEHCKGYVGTARTRRHCFLWRAHQSWISKTGAVLPPLLASACMCCM